MNNIKITSDLRWYIKILNMIYKIRNCIKGWKIYVKIQIEVTSKYVIFWINYTTLYFYVVNKYSSFFKCMGNYTFLDLHFHFSICNPSLRTKAEKT